MTASEQLVDRAQASPRPQRRKQAANAAADSPTLKTTRASRTSNKTAGLEVNGIEGKQTPSSPVKREKLGSVITEEVSPAPPKGATPKKTKQRKEVKQETQEHKPPAEETLKAAKRKRTVKAEKADIEVSEPSPKKTKREKATEVEVKVDETAVDEASPKKAARKTKVKDEEEVQQGEEGQKKAKRKRKTREERELEAMPLAARTDGLRMFIGAHVSGAKGRSFSMYIAPVGLRLFQRI